MAKEKNRYLVLLVLALGAVAIYFLPYLRWTFYDSLFEGEVSPTPSLLLPSASTA